MTSPSAQKAAAQIQREYCLDWNITSKEWNGEYQNVLSIIQQAIDEARECAEEYVRCRFCGKRNARHQVGLAGNAHFIRCNNCGAQGPWALSKQEAADLWDGRKAP